MIALKASQIAEIVGGNLVGSDVVVDKAPVFNSKEASKGSIFLALSGETRDGHDFVSEAFGNGIEIALVSKQVPERHILVPDVLKALGSLAKYLRLNLPELKVIAITGSQGKTTTKDLLTELLSGKGKTVSPKGNFNNELGAPLTLLECTKETKYCVVEMGARHIGDIAALCQIATPDIGVVLKVGSAHIGEFGSAEAIAKAKSEMISSLADDAIAVLGDYDQFTPAMAKLHKGRTILFGEKSDDEIRAADLEMREGCSHFDLVAPDGRASVGLRIVGIHQTSNALATAAVGHALGFNVDYIAGALSTATVQSKWRMQVSEFDSRVLINDAYNASPESMEAALRTLILFAQERGGQAWAFLGKMHELGESSPAEHARIGRLAEEIGIDHLVCIAAPEFAATLSGATDGGGNSTSSTMSVHICSDKNEAMKLIPQISEGDVILVKASRSEHLEELAESISQMGASN
jgi:UDP-N-acetylmuramoyl-tripeptide--D-alanyl-D-alanine ligase